MSSVGYHEPATELSDETRDMHRAIVSLMEELEAVDWYNQRADACKDPELKAILEHNRDEEKEHAAMVLEWIRRKDPALSREMKDYLVTEKPIAHTRAFRQAAAWRPAIVGSGAAPHRVRDARFCMTGRREPGCRLGHVQCFGTRFARSNGQGAKP